MLKHILKDDPVYRQLKDGIEDYRGPILVSGCTYTAKWHLTSLIGNKKKKVPDFGRGIRATVFCEGGTGIILKDHQENGQADIGR